MTNKFNFDQFNWVSVENDLPSNYVTDENVKFTELVLVAVKDLANDKVVYTTFIMLKDEDGSWSWGVDSDKFKVIYWAFIPKIPNI